MLRAQFTDSGFEREVHEPLSIGVLERGGELYQHRHGRDEAGVDDISFVNPMEPHASSAATPEGFAYRAFQPDPALLETVALEVTGQRANVAFRAPVVRDPGLARRLIDLHRDLEAGATHLETGVRVRAMLAVLIERYADVKLEPACSAEQAAARVAADYLEANLARNVRLEELAVLGGVNPFHLARSFTAVLGVPPHVYLTARRVERAKALLRAGHSPAAVALEVGFFDQSHLNRQFKRLVGVPSSAYQRATRVS